jgi:hypothetical protein
MKKIFLALTILATIALNATPKDKISSKVVTSFEKEFSGAADVKWSVSNDVVKANFTYQNSRTEAYFTTEGELIGTARNVLYNELPLAVSKEVEKRFGSAPVYEITEYYNEAGTGYLMTVDLGAKQLKVKSTSSGDVWIVKKMKK